VPGAQALSLKAAFFWNTMIPYWSSTNIHAWDNWNSLDENLRYFTVLKTKLDALFSFHMRLGQNF
jgi:hypothetical protein